MCSVKKSRTESNAINREERGVMATNISSRSNHLMNDHPTGRLLSRTVGINKIEAKRLSTGEYLSSQRKYESGDCSTTIYDGPKIKAGYNLDPPRLIDSDDEFESDAEAEAITETFFDKRTKPAPDTAHDASEKVTLEHESGSVPPRSTGAIRKRHVQNSDSDSTTTDIEERTYPRTEMHHHPVGRGSSGSALPDITSRIVPLSMQQL